MWGVEWYFKILFYLGGKHSLNFIVSHVHRNTDNPSGRYSPEAGMDIVIAHHDPIGAIRVGLDTDTPQHILHFQTIQLQSLCFNCSVSFAKKRFSRGNRVYMIIYHPTHTWFNGLMTQSKQMHFFFF